MRVFSSIQTDAWIKGCVAALGLGKKHDLATAARCIHGGLDEGISANSEDNRIGSAAISFCKDALYDVFTAGMDRIFKSVFGGDGRVAFRV